jgi:hypothetical protein
MAGRTVEMGGMAAAGCVTVRLPRFSIILENDHG